MAKKVTTTFIATVLNEEETVSLLLDSILSQSLLPDEVVIVDAQSSDQTVNVLKSYSSKFKNKKIKYKVLSKKGNRSIGRNYAVGNSTGEIILCSDSGCVLDQNWAKELTESFKNSIDVVIGYYQGLGNTVFQKSVVPYALQLNGDLEFPSTRSMAIRKSVWQKSGGLPMHYDYSEDLFFGRRLKKEGFKLIFNKKAVVYWVPRKDILAFFTMIYRFAYWDVVSQILRPKVVLIFLRYIVGLLILLLAIINESQMILLIALILLVLYLVWSVAKNYKNVRDPQAIIFLPVLQITSDIAVILGTLLGLNKWVIKKTL